MSRSVAEQWMEFLISMSLFTINPIIPITVGRYLRFVKPSYDNFVRPTATHADIVSRKEELCSWLISLLSEDCSWA